ncbi:hypothetical protein R6U77_08215 [Lysinibacillus louembei]|uniref:Uncharacterized protein n=1 Tax=Lysinibacillus louembei TaxID=1470088 RepID=A0ABZ0RZH3_9BACI|nr:hypothetical protein [Lysinibacillus louembei]WPK13633.1 hypothetical protein R6U77_08215 [Lysinibacillus louembei]
MEMVIFHRKKLFNFLPYGEIKELFTVQKQGNKYKPFIQSHIVGSHTL